MRERADGEYLREPADDAVRQMRREVTVTRIGASARTVIWGRAIASAKSLSTLSFCPMTDVGTPARRLSIQLRPSSSGNELGYRCVMDNEALLSRELCRDNRVSRTTRIATGSGHLSLVLTSKIR